MITTFTRVPHLSMLETGHTYGGQHYTEREYEITFETDARGGASVTLADTAGNTVWDTHLDEAELAAAHRMVTRAPEPPAKPIAGLHVAPVWSLGDDFDYVVLLSSQLEQVGAWLEYATGAKDWDGGPDWEY